MKIAGSTQQTRYRWFLLECCRIEEKVKGALLPA